MKKKPNVFRMIKYFFENRKATLYACVMCVLGLIIGIVTPICNKLIQEEIIPNKNISLFIWLTIVILVLNLVSVIASFFTTRIFINSGVPITSNIRKDIVKMNTLSGKNINHKGKVLIASTSFLEEANTFYISHMYLVFDCLLKFMFYFPFFLIYGGWLALIMIATTLFSILIINLISTQVSRTIEISKRVEAERYDYTLGLIKAMKKSDFKEDEKYNIKTYMKKVKACDKAWIVYCNWANLYGPVFNTIWGIGLGVCFCVAFNMIGTGAILISTFIVFNSYLEQLKVPIGNYISFKQVTDAYDETFKNVFEMLDDSELAELKNREEN